MADLTWDQKQKAIVALIMEAEAGLIDDEQFDQRAKQIGATDDEIEKVFNTDPELRLH